MQKLHLINHAARCHSTEMWLDCWHCHCWTVVCCVVCEVHDPQAIGTLFSLRMVLPFFVIRTSSAVNIAAHPWSQNFVTEMSEYSVSSRNKCLAVATGGSPHGGISSCPKCVDVIVAPVGTWQCMGIVAGLTSLLGAEMQRKWPVVLASMIAGCRSGSLGGSCSRLESK
jgi:hypothetical protein